MLIVNAEMTILKNQYVLGLDSKCNILRYNVTTLRGASVQWVFMVFIYFQVHSLSVRKRSSDV